VLAPLEGLVTLLKMPEFNLHSRSRLEQRRRPEVWQLKNDAIPNRLINDPKVQAFLWNDSARSFYLV
jgi:hypothetical protein